jgi:hypothetical protein
MQNTQPVENQKTDHEDLEPRPKANLFKWATVSTLLASLGYGSAYITGLVYHQTYLSRFNVPSDLFKGTTADYFVFAYMAWIESMPDWLQTLTADFRPLGLVFLFLLLNSGLAILLAIASNARWAKSAQLRLRKNGTLQVFGGLLLFPTLTVASLFLIPTGLTTAAIIPALVGQHGAVRTFTRDSAAFSKDCNASEIKIRCMDLMEENKLLATGYVIQASDRYIALLTLKGVHILPLKDRALRLHSTDNNTPSRSGPAQ